MWDAALQELERFAWSPQARGKEGIAYRAWIYLRAGRYDELMRLAAGADGEASEVIVPLAVAYAKQGAHELALRTAQRAARMRCAGAAAALGEIYSQLEDPQAALKWYERAAPARDGFRSSK